MESQTASNDSQRQIRHRRVILFPFPFQGHINPMLHLANLLYSKGFSITILHTNFNSPKTSNYPHFTFKSILDNDTKDKRSSKDIKVGVSEFLKISQHGGDALRKELELLLASSEKDERVSCLITDELWYFTQSVADSIDLPRLALRISSLLCNLVIASIPLFDARGYFDSSGTHLEEQVEGFPVLQVKDVQKFFMKIKNDHKEPLFANVIKHLKSCSGIVGNSFEELEAAELKHFAHDFQVPSFMFPFQKYFTGSLSSLIEEDDTFFPWLDKQPPNSVLYVSFGSTSQVDEKDFLEIAHGLVNSKQSFIWVVRPGFIKGSTWIEPLPNGLIGENGRIVKWAPQHQVLAHKATGAFWTHCGWNSTMESICEGVVMICTPFDIDQPLTAKYMSHVWKVAVYLENGLQREEISSVVRRVMADEEMRGRAKVLKEKVDSSLIRGGSSYESLEYLINYISSF